MMDMDETDHLRSELRNFRPCSNLTDSSASALPAASGSGTHVAILLATKNGAAFLPEQLNSYVRQTHTDWSVHISDDRSNDKTVEIARDFCFRISNPWTLREGPRAGSLRNFLSLLRDSSIEANYFAFSDQDDVWYPEKLERALSVIQRANPDQPALYCSRTELIDREGSHIGFSTRSKRLPSFRNALVENIAGGNTMVLNRAARELVKKVSDENFVIHDWSTYVFVSAAGGQVFYDRMPTVKYRQHANNLIGARTSLWGRARRVGSGQWQQWASIHLKALAELSSYITPENRKVIESFALMRRDDRLLQRLWYLWNSGVYRQTLLGQLGLLFSVITKIA